PPILDLARFCPNGMGNVTLVIEDNKIRVSKEYLAVHSPVFAAMFFGDFAEKGKEEIEINDVIYEEFIDLLYLVYPRTEDMTDRTVPQILKLADRFQMECLVKESERFLINSKGIDVMKKLLLADQYRLENLKDHCINSFTCMALLHEKLKTAAVFASLSDAMKIAICERMMWL
ncbi:hypothetical protein PMAYCL1PPCAC_25481, partial [Pristionchus mayeri]